MRTIKPPQAAGLYHPENEHDACGVAFVAKITGEADHGVVGRALYALENLEHRGAAGADPTTGDGAGILLQLPDEFFRAVVPFPLPERGRFAVGVLFLPQEQEAHDRIVALVDETIAGEGQRVLGWRDVPVDTAFVGVTAGAAAPRIRQVFVGAADELPDQLAFERKLYVIRRLIEKGAGPELAIPSFSSRTVVYKGMLTAPQMSGYYPDLKDERMVTRLALVHSRFSTNTFPSWELAHPYRMLAHNGEINTLRGNINWMRARESQLLSEHFGDDLDKIMPVVIYLF
jgi:glutamate synthase domain-containing protein 1